MSSKPEQPAETAAADALPTHRKVLFSALAVVLFFGLVELALALFGVRPVTVTEDPYVGFASYVRLFRPAGERLETAPQKLQLFNRQSFPRVKAPGTFRIFTVGGSTTYGRPFDDATSFSGWLRAYLEALPGSRRFEVVNAGGISYASYRVAKLMEELVDYQGDLFIIYSGNNEFLERRTYGELLDAPETLARTRWLYRHSRLWTLGRRLLDRPRRQAQQRYQLTGEVDELLNTSAGLDYYRRDDEFKHRVVDHYRFNLARMVELARGAGARTILVTVPVNEKDFPPFKSQYSEGLAPDERARHGSLLAAAAEALEDGRGAEGLEAAAAAVAIDSRHAEGHYLHGRALLALGENGAAGAAFARAIAEDVCPLRALDEMQAAIRETAIRDAAARDTASREAAGGGSVELVDFRRMLKDRSIERAGHPILGEEDFLDHVHPTVEANGVLARALVEKLAAMDLLELAADWRQQVGEEVSREVLARVDGEAYAEAYKNLSKVLLWAGKKRQAEEFVRKAREVSSGAGDWELHYNAAVVALDAGDPESARTSLLEAVRLAPGAARAWDQLGVAYAALGDLDAAVEAGERAVSLDPEMAGAWNNLGTTYDQAEDPERALEVIGKALEIDPGFADAHNNLGNIYFSLGQLDRALRSYDQALEHRPGFAQAMVNRGLVLGERGELDAARLAFERALELDADLPEAHFGRGKALAGRGDAAAAIPAFERAIELAPRHLEAYELLARSLTTVGRAADAEAVVARGLEAEPRAAALHHLRGRLRAQQKSYDEAGRSFERALELDAGLLQAWRDLGMLRLVQGRPEDAARVFRDGLEVHPEEAALHHSLGRVLMMTERPGEALEHLEKAVEIEPGNALAANDLAAVYEHLGRLGEALELYRRAARLDPDLAIARDNAARLGGRTQR